MPGIDRRAEPRRTYHAPIRFVLKGKEHRLLRGVVTNISLSGTGIYSFDHLSEGQEIVVKSTLPGSHVAYAVRWSNKLADDFYIVGLRMVETTLTVPDDHQRRSFGPFPSLP